MRIFNFKKSQEALSNWPFWIAFIIASGIVSLVIVAIANVNVREISKIPEYVEDEINLMSRFYNSDDCFAYKDDLRVYTRVIDADKFKQANMLKCFPRSNVKYAFSLSLEVSEIDFTLGPINTFNWEGSRASKEVTEDVLVMYEDSEYNGKLIIGIKNVK